MLLLLIISSALATEPVGATLPVTPSVPPGIEVALPDDPLAEALKRYNEWDNEGALAILEPYLASPQSYKQRTSTRLLLGRVYMELGDYNLASAQFYRVRVGKGGDAKVAAWYEILADLERNRPHAAIRECNEYIERFGEGRRASECMVIIGDAEAARGRLYSARKAYDAYINSPDHKGHLREEEMSLRLALATAKHKPERAIPQLIHLSLNHRFAATGAGANAALNRLHEDGHSNAVLPTDARSRMALAESLRRSGWVDEAWSHFKELEGEADSNPEIAAWIKQSAKRFERSTRHHLPRIKFNIEQYEKGNKTGAIAWAIFEDWKRAGRWDKAAEWGRIGLSDHAKQWPWRGRKDDVAHAIMLSGDFASATEAWDSALKAKHGPTRQARFYRSLCAMLAGDLERAHAGFSTLINQGGPLEMASRYWRIRTAEKAGRSDTMNDRMRIEVDDTVGWYRLLLKDTTPAGDGWVIRDGTWGGPPSPRLPDRVKVPASDELHVEPRSPPFNSEDPDTALVTPESAANLAGVQWPFVNQVSETPETVESEVPSVDRTIPSSSVASAHYNPENALAILRRLGDRHQEIWPDLKDAYHLAQAGLVDESGPIVRAAYEEYRNPSAVQDPKRRAAIEALNITKHQWMSAAIVSGDYYFQTKHLWNMKTEVDPEALARLQFPIAYGRELWPHCQLWNLDPFLVLSIMRQESIYNPEALSHTGAIGLMQIIKGTGAKLSALLDEPLFSPVTLYNPSVNLRYSVYYLRLLNERFNGNFPMAVASYNGGPHHMSRAHRQTLGKLELDAFVEMIPREEPRNYVKKVVGYYQRYVELYGPPGASVVLPQRLDTDSPEVVNF